MPVSAIIFLIAFAAGCVLAFVRHPVFGLVTYVVTLYLDPSGQWWGQFGLANFRWELLPGVITLIAMMLHRRSSPSPVYRSGAFQGFVIFVLWIVIQFLWALDTDAQGELLSIWSKFLIVAIMICGCVDSWSNLRWVLWAHVGGCVYMGWIAYEFYQGGRFEGFGLGSIGDANTGAIQLVTGFLAAGSLFLSGSWRVKAVLLVGMGLIANGIITTESREAFLALGLGGLAFIICSPKAIRRRVMVASVAAAMCFLALTSANYWNRINTIKAAGAEVQGVDTGHARLVYMQGQWRMFQQHPLGCGHSCTELLSPQFIPPEYIPFGGHRASHNTFMTMLVDHGIPGGVLYIALLLWVYRKLKYLREQAQTRDGLAATFLPGAVGVMVAITIGDLFGGYVLLEVRVWFVSLLIAYANLLQLDTSPTRGALDALRMTNAEPALN